MFDEAAPVQARARAAPGSQDVQLYDVVQVAHHFGVSRAAACYRLKSARLITGAELDSLIEQDRAGRGREPPRACRSGGVPSAPERSRSLC